jgi:hypothetical protein
MPPGKQAAPGDTGKTAAAPARVPVQMVASTALDHSSAISSSAFNQLVAQLVAESADPEPAPRSGVQVPTGAAQAVKLPPKSTTAAAVKPLIDQPSELPVRVVLARAPPSDTSILAAAPVGGRRADARGAIIPNSGDAQPPSLPVDLNIPIPIAPKLQLPLLGGGSSTQQRSVTTPTAVSNAEDSAPMTLEPRPILEVKIHLNQPLTETLLVQKQTAPASPSFVAGPSVDSESAKPNTTIPDVAATRTVVPPVASAPVVSPPIVSRPAVATPTVATPAVFIPPVSAPAAPAPTGPSPSVSMASVPIPIASPTATPVSAAGAVDTQPTVAASPTHGAQEETAKQQNPERGSPDPGGQDTGPAVGHAAPRTTGNQEVIVTVQPQRQDAGSTPPLAHDASTSPVGPVPAAPPPAPAPMSAGDAKPEPQATSAPMSGEPPVNPAKPQQPLRSLALEFTPDGAGDVKVRLSERGGDVHISLHGTDAALAGRMREGVSDLVGSLSKAGYDAEAWTPGQGRQNQRQQPDQRQSARGTASPGDAEEFSGILQEPIQEIS